MRPAQPVHSRLHRQRGIVMLLMLVILVLGASALLLRSLSSAALRMERDKVTADALAQAKQALIGSSVSQSPVTSAGDLQLPDLGFVGTTLTEGKSSAPPNFLGNNQDYSVIGKVPWKTLGISPSRDGQGECLWYVVSGSFKNTPPTSALNWDTPGQIDVIDGNGNVIASNIAALLVAPGQPLDGQNRTLADPVYTQCGGNYDARNYLDSYNSSDAIMGEVNYFTGSTNNRVAPNTSNKRFVLANNSHYNDQFLFITTDDIFTPIIRRSDFSAQITALLNDAAFIAHLQSTPITGTKGTDLVDCSTPSTSSNRTFCANWKEMLLLTRLAPASNITISVNGTPTTFGPCGRVLIFGGQKSTGQKRITTTDKSAPANYLENQNLAAFAIPNAVSGNFSGNYDFNVNNPSADLLRCLP